MYRYNLIEKIISNVDKLGIDLDCSRYENSEKTYTELKNWFLKFYSKQISLSEYLNGLDIEILNTMVNKINSL